MRIFTLLRDLFSSSLSAFERAVARQDFDRAWALLGSAPARLVRSASARLLLASPSFVGHALDERNGLQRLQDFMAIRVPVDGQELAALIRGLSHAAIVRGQWNDAVSLVRLLSARANRGDAYAIGRQLLKDTTALWLAAEGGVSLRRATVEEYCRERGAQGPITAMDRVIAKVAMRRFPGGALKACADSAPVLQACLEQGALPEGGRDPVWAHVVRLGMGASFRALWMANAERRPNRDELGTLVDLCWLYNGPRNGLTHAIDALYEVERVREKNPTATAA